MYAKIDLKDNDLVRGIQAFLKTLMTSDRIDALLVPCQLPGTPHLMPTLVTDPALLDQADPLAPCFPLNAAKMASRLTKRHSGKPLGLVLRPCEIRALVELVKLKQGSLENVTLISTDCLGAYSNKDFRDFSVQAPKRTTQTFYEPILAGSGSGEGALADACQVCEHPVSKTADIVVQILGADPSTYLVAQSQTPKGEALLQESGLTRAKAPAGRDQAVTALVQKRIVARDDMFDTIAEATGSIAGLSEYLGGCVNCYNCRVACPVCYCKECVFVTDVFDHDPFQYLEWARQKGGLRMPTDTAFFHITRMAHMALSCVGCGQCSNACPNDIPLAALFRTVAHHVQQDFGYQAGQSIEEPIPLSVFKTEEFDEVVGLAP